MPDVAERQGVRTTGSDLEASPMMVGEYPGSTAFTENPYFPAAGPIGKVYAWGDPLNKAGQMWGGPANDPPPSGPLA